MRYLFILFLFLPAHLYAQLITNQWGFGATGVSITLDVIPTNDNGLIFIQTASQNSFDKNCVEYGLGDAWIFKTDASYNMLWQSCYGSADGNEGAIRGIATSDGGFITIGSTTATTLSGNNTALSNGGFDYLVIKFDQNGNILWDKNFGGIDNDAGYGIAAMNDSTFVIIGTSLSNAGFDKTDDSFGGGDVWVLAIDEVGNKLWDKTFGGIDSEYIYNGQIICLPETNSIYFVAESHSDVSGNKTIPSYGTSDIWMVKLDYNGSLINQFSFGGNSFEASTLLFHTGDDHLIIGGPSYSGISGNKTSEARGMRGCWILKTDLNGNIVWDVTLGGTSTSYSEGPFCYLETENEVLFVAGSNSNIGFDKTEVSRGSTDLWLLFIDPVSGELLRQKTIGGNQFEHPVELSMQANSITLYAASESGISGEKTIPKISPISYDRDRWIIQLDKTTLNQKELVSGDISVYPNPANELLHLSGLQSYAGKELLLTNALGQPVYREDIHTDSMSIPISNLRQGIYFITITSGPTIKVVVE